MQDIAELSEEIEDELCDAEKYIDKALKKKTKRPTLAATYAKLSAEELNHANILHEQVVILINEYRAKNGEPPERMMGRYDYVHEKYMDKAMTIRVKQALFKG